MKRRFTSLLLVAMMILTAFAGTFTIGAETPPVITLLEGAAIRCVEPSGIRFISQISTENAEAATEIGTYIFPYAEYKASGAATPQDYFATNGAKFVKIVAEDGIHTDGDVTHIYAALVNIKPTNYCRDFAAISYAIIDGQTSYSAFDEGKNVRNIREIAVAAYNDFSTEANYVDGPYTYWNQVSEGLWSCYSDEARAVIATYDDAIFRLANNGSTAWNGAANGPAMGIYETEGGAATWTMDAGKNAVSFTNEYSYYFNVDDNLSAEFADGFSYEVWVKPTAVIAKNYTEVVDFEELGGWGLNLYPGSAENTVKLSAEVAKHKDTGSAGDNSLTDAQIKTDAYDWYKLTHEVAINDWYHVVFTYNDYGMQLYVNGVMVASNYWMFVRNDYHAPTFYKNTAHVSIGAGASGGIEAEGASKGGFDGALAGLVVYPNAATATDVERMYYTGTCNIDQAIGLKFDNGAVSNSIANGPTINKITSGSDAQISVGTVDGLTAATFSAGGVNAYRMDVPKYYEPYITDGFSFEVYFKTPETLVNGGILDCELNGGFSLELKSNGSLFFEQAYATEAGNSRQYPFAWKSFTVSGIQAGTWYHVAYTFDGTNGYMYVNGELKGTVKLPEDHVPSNVRGNGLTQGSTNKIAYLILGGQANGSGTYTRNTFGGSIAVCNYYLQNMTQEEAAAAYNKITKATVAES